MLELIGSIAQPPTYLEMPKTEETIFNIFIGIPVVISLVWAIKHLRDGKGPLLLCCLIGGLLACTMEPLVDVLGMVYLKETDAVGTITIFDRTMPLYIPFVYTWYVGGLGYVAYRMMERGLTMKMLFTLWAVDCVVDIFLESPGILAETYLYYGHQPLDIWGFPMWWGFVNPLMPMIAGALIYKLKPHLDGWKILAVIPCIPMADGIANGATAWPMWFTLNQNDSSYWITYPAAFATLGLALFCVWIISLIVAKPEDDVSTTSLKELILGLSKGEEPAPAQAKREPERVPVGA